MKLSSIKYTLFVRINNINNRGNIFSMKHYCLTLNTHNRKIFESLKLNVEHFIIRNIIFNNISNLTIIGIIHCFRFYLNDKIIFFKFIYTKFYSKIII